jgi:hypothetical protein
MYAMWSMARSRKVHWSLLLGRMSLSASSVVIWCRVLAVAAKHSISARWAAVGAFGPCGWFKMTSIAETWSCWTEPWAADTPRPMTSNWNCHMVIISILWDHWPHLLQHELHPSQVEWLLVLGMCVMHRNRDGLASEQYTSVYNYPRVRAH